MKNDLITAAISGNSNIGGSIPGLEQITGIDADTVDLDPNTDGDQTIESIVQKHVSDGMQEFIDQTPGDSGNKTIDEIFKETIEDTNQELLSYDPEIFSGT